MNMNTTQTKKCILNRMIHGLNLDNIAPEWVWSIQLEVFMRVEIGTHGMQQVEARILHFKVQ